MFHRLVREPLVHFLAIGALLFGIHAIAVPDDGRGGRIEISAPMVAAVAAQHAQLWGRPPTGSELDAMIEQKVREEILYREGLAMGLDRDDAVTQRRVRQKYELIAEEEDSVPVPTDEELEQFLAANPAKFRRPPVVSFEQVMVDPGVVPAARLRLAAGADLQSVGKSSLLPPTTVDAPLDQVARDFGWEFAAALLKVPLRSWSGPVSSGFGTHLVRVGSRRAAETPKLPEIRKAVRLEWEAARRSQAREARMTRLRGNYHVVIERPDQ